MRLCFHYLATGYLSEQEEALEGAGPSVGNRLSYFDLVKGPRAKPGARSSLGTEPNVVGNPS